jgi:hypothetical protein
MTMRQNLVFALTGWLAGLCSIVGVALLVFPALLGTPKSIRTAPDLFVFVLVVLLVSPAALVGGLIGGRTPKEGGQSVQLIMAAVVAVIAAVPLSCVAFWYTGW